MFVRVLIVLAVVVVVAAHQPNCPDCSSVTCPPEEDCPGAQAMDACGCCVMCKRSLGQRCDHGANVEYGPCGDYLQCKRRGDLVGSREWTCQCSKSGEVCGSDGVTYATICHLTEKGGNLTAMHDEPCPSKPVIRSPPASSSRRKGGILVLDCEAVGYPVPEIYWEQYKPTGETVMLPNDDPSVAVQTRGGPEPHMVTGWVQIMKVTDGSFGTYACNAKNKHGHVKATAVVEYAKP